MKYREFGINAISFPYNVQGFLPERDNALGDCRASHRIQCNDHRLSKHWQVFNTGFNSKGKETCIGFWMYRMSCTFIGSLKEVVHMNMTLWLSSFRTVDGTLCRRHCHFLAFAFRWVTKSLTIIKGSLSSFPKAAQIVLTGFLSDKTFRAYLSCLEELGLEPLEVNKVVVPGFLNLPQPLVKRDYSISIIAFFW